MTASARHALSRNAVWAFQVIELVFNGPGMMETAKDLLSVGFAVTMGLAEAQGEHSGRGDSP